LPEKKKKKQKENKIKSNVVSSHLFGNRHGDGDDYASSLSPSQERPQSPPRTRKLPAQFCELRKARKFEENKEKQVEKNRQTPIRNVDIWTSYKIFSARAMNSPYETRIAQQSCRNSRKLWTKHAREPSSSQKRDLPFSWMNTAPLSSRSSKRGGGGFIHPFG
jgi:hypothetical protein